MNHQHAIPPDTALKRLCEQTPQQWAALFPVETIAYKPLTQLGITLGIKREDRLDHRLSGNKLYKLYGHIQEAKRQGAQRLISFGGYYSNHLHALSYFGGALQIPTVGFVRGHHPESLSLTLQDCLQQGMQLEFLSRKAFRAYQSLEGTELLQRQFPDAYVIPEGGGASLGQAGCKAIMAAVRNQISLENTTVCVACGTGTTLAGMLSNSCEGESLLGFSALKLGEHLQEYKDTIAEQIRNRGCGARWDIIDEQQFGGFAKTTPELISFMNHFEADTGVLLDPVYTAKMLFNVVRLAQEGYWQKGHQIVVIHTGGLQGRRGIQPLSLPTHSLLET